MPSDNPSAAAVLDTNVALDWLLFDDEALRPLALAIGAGRVRWLATAAMRAEFADVLSRPGFAYRNPDCEQMLSQFDRWALLRTAPSAAPDPALRCADSDDQGFIDLAVASQARWLFTRDKALLALRPAAQRHGVAILAPREGQAAA